jgi:hypothetical protein
VNHSRSNPRRPRQRAVSPAPGRARSATGPATGSGGRLAAVAGVVAALAALLSGCGIRDTSLPVDAGQGASRTACPPSPGASLSQLDRDAYAAQSTGAPGWPVPEATGPRAVPSATASPTPSPTLTGPLSCLQPSGTGGGSGTGSPTGTPSAAVTASP